MATLISGATGIDKVQDSSITSAKIADGAITNTDINSSAAIAGTKLVMPTGSVLQVVTGELTSYVSLSTQSWQNTGLSGTITPSSTSNKILITVSFGGAQTTQSNGDHTFSMRLLRNSSDSDLNGVADGIRPRALFSQGGHSYNAGHFLGGFSITGLDAPSTTSAITYSVQGWPQSSSYPLILNGPSNNSNESQTYSSRTKAIITMMEIAG